MARTGRDPRGGLTHPSQHVATEAAAQPTPGSIRMGTADDIDAVYALNLEVFPEAWSRKALSEAIAHDYELRVWNTTDGELCAYTLSRDTLDELHILQLAVSPAWRRRGLARRLTQHLLEEKRRAGSRLAYLEVRFSNAAAQALYAGLGFAPSGRRRDYYTPLPGNLRREDAMLMTLML